MILFIVLGSFGLSHSQSVWTLEKCVEHALRNNLTIRQTYINQELSKINHQQNMLNFVPTLNANMNYNINRGRNVDPTTNLFTTNDVQSLNGNLTTNVIVFNGFLLQNSLKQSRFEYLASKSDLEKIKNDVSLNIVASYLQVLFAQDQVDISKDALRLSELQRNRSKSLVDAGILPQGSLLDAESQYSNSELQNVSAENALSTSLLNLKQLLDLDSVTDFSIEAPIMSEPDNSILLSGVDYIYQTALQGLPQIKAATLRTNASQKGISIARSGMFPRISVSGGVGTNYSDQARTFDTTSLSFAEIPFDSQIEDNFYKAAGVNLSIPLFNNFSVKNNIARAKLSYKNVSIQEDLTKKTVYKEIQQAHSDALGAKNKFDALNKAEKSAKEAFDYANKKFDAGLINSLEYTNAQNNFTRTKSERTQALYDYVFKIKVLEFYSGKKLTIN
ncbi:MAG TPA: TolC family protein [Bacteroidia bacterium]|nr:TolC family protein [Bacteroidia bacterium]HNT79368.1 TolC family protein [Bacteroidia bacterium]